VTNFTTKQATYIKRKAVSEHLCHNTLKDTATASENRVNVLPVPTLL
jgi:hypothetical protein